MKINTITVLAVLVLLAIAFFAGVQLQPYLVGQPAAAVTSTGAAGFSIVPTPATLTATAGTATSVVSSIGIQAVNGFNGPVTLTVSGACGLSGITCSPTQVTVNLFKNALGITPFTVTSSPQTPIGMYIITLKGNAGGMMQSANILVKVSKASK